jgi:hypothetical protein
MRKSAMHWASSPRSLAIAERFVELDMRSERIFEDMEDLGGEGGGEGIPASELTHSSSPNSRISLPSEYLSPTCSRIRIKDSSIVCVRNEYEFSILGCHETEFSILIPNETELSISIRYNEDNASVSLSALEIWKIAASWKIRPSLRVSPGCRTVGSPRIGDTVA